MPSLSPDTALQKLLSLFCLMSSLTGITSANIPGAVLNAALITGKLNLCHGNAQSLCARRSNKLDEVKNLLKDSKVGIACFTESWLTSQTSNRSIAVPGYSLVRNDRLYRRGGGIVIYYKEGLHCSKVYSTELSSTSDDLTECLAVELRFGNERVLLMCVYNPPENDCSNFLYEKLTDFAVRYENVVLIGDFNTDMYRPNRKRSQFQSMLHSLSLTSIGEEPTFFYRDGCSQLDLLITSDREKVLRFNQVSFPCLSQHDLIFGSLDFDVTPVETSRTYRDYVNFDAQAVANAINSIPWNQFYAIDDPDELVEFFNYHIINVHNECIPLRTANSRRTSNGWFNFDVRKSMIERDMAYQDWRRAPPEYKDQARQQYKRLRNQTNSVISSAKEQYMSRFLDSRMPSKVLWQRVKKLGVGKEKAFAGCDFDPDEVNRMFVSNFAESENDWRRGRGRGQAIRNSSHCFSFRPVEYWEVVNAVCEAKSNAVGLDGLPIKFIQIILPLVVEQITHMYNFFIRHSVFPKCWKHAKILPIRKQPHLNALSNLRPISILCALSKIFEKLVEKQMSLYITENNLLSEFQAGFRKGQSVKTAIIRVYDDLAVAFDKKGGSVLLLLDFSKAFDTIPHHRLCMKLETQFNFSSDAVNLLSSYLTDRKQTVFCGDRRSNDAEVSSGVPQGSVLGPLLFCCYINDLPNVLKYCSIQLYADDVQLYISRLGPSTREMIRMMNEDLERITHWSQRNGLHVNQAKSKALLIRSRSRTIAQQNLLPNIVMDGQVIQWTDRANNLGFVFQNDLQWDGLIRQQCGKIYASLRTLYTCASSAPVETRLKLFKSLILPHFLFGDVIHVNPSVALLDRLRVALNCCVRFVYGLNRYSRVSHLQQNLIGCPFQRLYAHRSCLFIKKLMTTCVPTTLHQRLVPFRGRRLQNLVIPANNTSVYANSLFVRGVVNWNMLPTVLKRSTSEAIFRRDCLRYWNRL